MTGMEESNKATLTRPLQVHGTKGKSAEVITNHMMVKIPKVDVHMYTAVTEGLKPRERKEKLDALYKHLMNTGKKVFASGNMILSFTRDLEEDYQVPNGKTWNKETKQETDYLVPMKVLYRVTRNLGELSDYVKDQNARLTPSDVQELLQVVDILVKFDPTFTRIVMGVGQFTTDLSYQIQDSHLRLLKGMQTHAKLSDKYEVVLNVDAKYHAIFEELNLLDAFRKSKCPDSILRKEFKGVKVFIESKTTKRRMATIVDISKENAKTYKITDADGNPTMSVQEYFDGQGVKLKYPDALLVCTNKKRNTFYPPELLKIAPNQSYDKPIPDINTIRNETCLKPFERLRHIENLMRRKEFQIDPSSQIEADNHLLKVPARFLKAPHVKFADGTRQPGRKNDIDTRGAKFVAPCALKSYAIVNFSDVPYRAIDGNLIRNLNMTARNHGVHIPGGKPVYVECRLDKRGSYDAHDRVEAALKEAYADASRKSAHAPDIIICISPSITSGVYNHVKKLTETTGFFKELVMTQFCCADKFVERRGRVTVNPQFCSNLWLKMNEKLSYAQGTPTNAWRLYLLFT